jgi:hypothetical protein
MFFKHSKAYDNIGRPEQLERRLVRLEHFTKEKLTVRLISVTFQKRIKKFCVICITEQESENKRTNKGKKEGKQGKEKKENGKNGM